MRRVCGLDVHKDSIYMCILYENGSKIESVFGVLTPELDKLRDLLVSHQFVKLLLRVQVSIGFQFGIFCLLTLV